MDKLKLILKNLTFAIGFMILVACPGSTQVEYEPSIELIKKNGAYLYTFNDSQDTMKVTCLYTKIFSSKKYNENIVVIINHNKDYKTPIISSSNNGKLRLYKKNANEKIFVLNDSSNFKKIKLKNDSVNIKFDELNNLVFLYKK